MALGDGIGRNKGVKHWVQSRQRDYYKAIDDFVKLINECSGWTPNCIESSHDICLTVYTLHQIAEKLKEGGRDED